MDYTFFSDLDSTLIYGIDKLMGKPYLPIEFKNRKEFTGMTFESVRLLKEISKKCNFVPITTRNLLQYNRLIIDQLFRYKHALVLNGAILLENGLMDQAWYDESIALRMNAESEYIKLHNIKLPDKSKLKSLSVFDYIEVYDYDMESTYGFLMNELNGKYVNIISNRNKIYIIPKGLDKGSAVQRYKKRFGTKKTVATGDSNMDESMFRFTDEYVYIPYDGMISSENTLKIIKHMIG